VFDRFWQARRGASQRGTGLGLAISRGIVEAHGGSISAESEVGRGSAFRFTVPVAPRNAES
jgi:signal transduction histidine kinase